MRFTPSRWLVLSLLVSFFFTGCQTAEEKAEKDKKKQEKEDAVYKIRDSQEDTSFKAFVGRLRKAVAMRDVVTMKSMMTADFGYRWEAGSDGFGCFKYWDEHNLWPELQAVIAEDFVPKKDYLVAPPESVEMGAEYGGFTAGIKRVNGSFKFAYFIPPEDADMSSPAQ